MSNSSKIFKNILRHVFFSPFSIAITSLEEEKANLSAFRSFVRFVLVWICRFPLPLNVWEGLLFVIVALPGFFSYLFLNLNELIVYKPLFHLNLIFSMKEIFLKCRISMCFFFLLDVKKRKKRSQGNSFRFQYDF